MRRCPQQVVLWRSSPTATGKCSCTLPDDFAHIAWPGHGSLLGGGADGEETPHDAIVRELHEEAGLVSS
ncbi:NUDIX domain-containing protein [Jiangella endophytica]|uniref:NUDIX domain-containing protein n=1 Tax=Jiangella endophytica TaxID=1623398 RepID=UPI0038CC1E28